MASIAPDITVTACCVWLTGPPGAGKRTIANGLVDALREHEMDVVLLDEHTASAHLVEGPDAIAWLCRLLVTHGVQVVVSVPMPARDDRDLIRDAVPGFVEVFVDRARHHDGYEEPFAPELRIPTHDRSPSASVAQLVSWLEDSGFVGRA
jgi:adenylylsulfate kinase-like enzyme